MCACDKCSNWYLQSQDMKAQHLNCNRFTRNYYILIYHSENEMPYNVLDYDHGSASATVVEEARFCDVLIDAVGKYLIKVILTMQTLV